MEYVVGILAVIVIVVYVVRSAGAGASRIGGKLKGDSTDEEMKRLAAAARLAAKKEYRLDLTHDRASISDLENEIMQDLHHNQLITPYPEEELTELSRLWGAYVGEILRRVRAGIWQSRSRHGDRRPMPFVIDRNHEVFPCSWVYRRIKHGPEYSVHRKACEFADNRDNPKYALKGEE